MTSLARFRNFIQAFTRLVETEGGDEQKIFVSGKPLLEDLVSNDDWLPSEFSRSDPDLISTIPASLRPPGKILSR